MVMMKFSHRVGVLMILCLAACGFLFLWGIATYWGSATVTGAVRRGEALSGHMWPFGGNDETLKNLTHGKNVRHQSPTAGIGKAQCDFNTLDLLKQADAEFGKRFKSGIHVRVSGNQGEELILTKPTTRPLRVFVIPNSHNDPGWLKTLQGYFSDQTKPMLDAMVEKLTKYPKMTFIWAESVFLELWWSELESEMKETVRRLIEQRQLEIVGGGWVVPDEANPTYYALIDQLIEGHQWLEHTLMVKPNNSWSLDPFGYSSTLAYIYKKAGMQNMAIQRVHRDVKDILQNKQSLEFRWRQHWDTAGKTDMFTLMMFGMLYNIKHTCGPDPAICLQFDFRKIPGEMSESRAEPIHQGNVERQSKKLLGQYYKKAKHFKHSVVIAPIGDDFRFDRPVEWDQQYKNYQMLFNYMNSRPEWNVVAKFGTLQDYFDAVHEEMKMEQFPSLSGDFFPYTDTENAFWTGYYTTRAFEKKLDRELESHLRASDMLLSYVIGASRQHEHEYSKEALHFNLLQYAHRSLGLFQHHDAITGTARTYVAMDYEERLMQSLDNTHTVITKSVEYLLDKNVGESVVVDLDDSHEIRTVARDRKVLSIQHGERFVTVFNPIAHERQQVVHVLVSSDHVAVFSDQGRVVPSQLHPFWKDDVEISQKVFELMFFVTVGPLATRTYTVRSVVNPEANGNYAATIQMLHGDVQQIDENSRFKVLPIDDSAIILENAIHRTRFSPRTGFLHSVTTKHSVVTTKVNLQFLMYKSRGSGAYIFAPAVPAVDAEFSSRPLVRVLRGPLLSEVHSIQRLVHHTARLYNTTLALGWALEFENAVDLREMEDKEMVMRFTTDVGDTSDHFFVDLNSLHVRKRGRFTNYPLQANFYPMNSVAYLEDKANRFSIFSAQPHGCASLQPGQLEIMLDRRLSYDDGRGLGEGITDNKNTPSKFYLTLERKLDSSGAMNEDSSFPSLLGHTLSNYLNRPLFSMFLQNGTGNNHIHFPFAVEPLPCDVRLVAIRPIPKVAMSERMSVVIILHRLSFHEGFPTGMLNCVSTSQSLSLGMLFPDGVGTKVRSVKEMTLSLMHEIRSLDLYTEITLQPMDMVAYKVTF